MLSLAVNCALGAWAAAAAGTDLHGRRIPNLLLLAAVLPALVLLGWTGHGPLGAAWLPSLAGAALALVLVPGYRSGAVGAGDVKLAATLGLLLGGLGAVEMLLLGAASLGLVSAVLLATGRRAKIPAAPFLAGAFLLQLLCGRLL